MVVVQDVNFRDLVGVIAALKAVDSVELMEEENVASSQAARVVNSAKAVAMCMAESASVSMAIARRKIEAMVFASRTEVANAVNTLVARELCDEEHFVKSMKRKMPRSKEKV
ncbi:Hypothetical protein PHPALM_20266 [Phytophthora palmivora]|uniref:Uncharacterized protein n=1 Tax=Phytophthora palmivora TaxID=4796 RepID=A0A2P4XFB6_9STRA|nr:Hypothetical protein PHPALM_20266 [Phytophthora palmivora]